MKTRLISFAVITSFACLAFGGDPLDKIIRYQIKTIRANEIPLTQYLVDTKPYGKWDSRPVTTKEITFDGSTIGARSVPNFIWGVVGNGSYKLPQENLSNTPTEFLNYAWSQRSSLIETGKKFEKTLLDLADKVKATKASIYVNQWSIPSTAYRRVDEIFFENEKYWSYVKTTNWPHFMSTSVEFVDAKFTAEDEVILSEIKKLGFYCILQTEEHIVFMVDGLLDNSYGYVVGKTKPTDEALGHLFHICDSEKIGENLYLYTSN